jgi:Domain of unknown function (DUF4440)
MKKTALTITTVLLLAFAAFGQSAEVEKKEILKVFNEYLKAMQAEQPERDRVRERLLTGDYFYMGVDGLPASKKIVMERQKRNGLKINSLEMTNLTIHLYGKTAILTMRSEPNSGVDKGKPWTGAASGHTTVMVKQKGAWLVAADIVGRDIEN